MNSEIKSQLYRKVEDNVYSIAKYLGDVKPTEISQYNDMEFIRSLKKAPHEKFKNPNLEQKIISVSDDFDILSESSSKVVSYPIKLKQSDILEYKSKNRTKNVYSLIHKEIFKECQKKAEELNWSKYTIINNYNSNNEEGNYNIGEVSLIKLE